MRVSDLCKVDLTSGNSIECHRSHAIHAPPSFHFLCSSLRRMTHRLTNYVTSTFVSRRTQILIALSPFIIPIIFVYLYVHRAYPTVFLTSPPYLRFNFTYFIFA